MYNLIDQLRLCLESDEMYDVDNEQSTTSANDLDTTELDNILQTEAEYKTNENDEGTLNDLVQVLESHGNGKLNNIEETSLRLTLNKIKSFNQFPLYLFGAESYKSPDYVTLATEGMKEKLKDFKQKTGDIIKKIWEAVRNFIKSFTDKGTKLINRTKKLLSYISENPYEGGRDMSDFKLLQQISLDGKVDAETIQYINEVIEDLFDLKTISIAKAITESEEADYIKYLIEMLNDYAGMCVEGLNKHASKTSTPENSNTSEVNNLQSKFRMTDTWSFGIKVDNEIKGVVIFKDLAKIEKIKALSLEKDDLKNVLEKVKQILINHNSEDSLAADKIIKKASDGKAFSDNTELKSLLKITADVVIKRSLFRYEFCEALIQFCEMAIKKSKNPKSGTKDTSKDNELDKLIEIDDVEGIKN